jgi:hypothetical protein
MNNTVYGPRSVTINLPHNRYVDRILRSNSFEVLRHIFMNADSPCKEISESVAAFHNLKRFTQITGKDWLHIGDGGWCRTAAIFTMYSKSTNTSVDPMLNLEKIGAWIQKYNITGLTPIKSKFEEITMDLSPYNITCVHAHVDLRDVDKLFPNWTYLYSNPCCYPSTQSFPDDYMEKHGIICLKDDIDLGILSERRRVLVYKKITLNQF